MWNLKNRLLIPSLSVLALGFFLIAFFSNRVATENLEKVFQEEMAQVGVMGEKQITSWLSGLRRNVVTWSQMPILHQVLEDPEILDSGHVVLDKIKKNYDSFEFICLTNAQGDVVTSSNPELTAGTRVNDRPYFRTAMKGDTALSPVLASKVTGNPVFVVAAPIKKGQDVQGVVFAVVELQKFTSEILEPIRIGEKGFALLADAQGLLIYHPDPSMILKSKTEDFSWGDKIRTEAKGFFDDIEQGEKKFWYFTTEKESGWKLLISASREDIGHLVTGMRNLNTGMAVGTLLIVGMIIFFLVRSISNALRKGVDFAEAVRQGDVSKRLELVRTDELGELASALNHMADNLEEKARLTRRVADGDLTVEVALASEKDLLGHALTDMVANLNELLTYVQSSGEQIASGSAQVADGSQSLSQGATEQASSLEEITASMTEMSSQTRQSAENAGQANLLSDTAREAAEQGNAQMQQMVQAMGEINTASQDISKIIKTIDEIAFQTNLLALNAAVEAARAGQHGKGFAVVAEEVRNLAARSARAARETAELIEGSVKKTENGSQIADRTAGALGEIVGGITKVSDLVAEIAAASNEQAQGIAQVSQGLGQIDQVTQQNTAAAEQSAAAAEELSGQAAQLQQMLRRFKLKQGPMQATVAATQSKTDLKPITRSGEENRKDANHGKDRDLLPVKPREVIALDDAEFGRY